MTDINPQDYYASVNAGNTAHALSETIKLHETIKQQIEASTKQSAVIDKLTKFMAALAVVQTIATVVQVWPIINSRDSSATQSNAAENRPPKQTSAGENQSRVSINQAASAISHSTNGKSNSQMEKSVPTSK